MSVIPVIERDELLARAASLYYEDELTQDEIALQIGTSRSTVSRMLQEARETGVVEIIVHHPWQTVPDLEFALENQFGLERALVLYGRRRAHSEILRGLGVLAARYLEKLLTAGMVLSISWGKAVNSTVKALRSRRTLPMTVVQMVGAVGEGDPQIDGPELARLLAGVFGGEYRYLHAPLIVGDVRTQGILSQEPRIRETLALARRADVALVGIGAPLSEDNSLLRAGFLDRAALSRLHALGVVGDLCARHYDASGRELDIELNRRVVGLELNALHGIRHVIAVAAGEAKAEAVLGALRGRYVKELVTDDAAATAILTLDEGRATSYSE